MHWPHRCDQCSCLYGGEFGKERDKRRRRSERSSFDKTCWIEDRKKMGVKTKLWEVKESTEDDWDRTHGMEINRLMTTLSVHGTRCKGPTSFVSRASCRTRSNTLKVPSEVNSVFPSLSNALDQLCKMEASIWPAEQHHWSRSRSSGLCTDRRWWSQTRSN